MLISRGWICPRFLFLFHTKQEPEVTSARNSSAPLTLLQRDIFDRYSMGSTLPAFELLAAIREAVDP